MKTITIIRNIAFLGLITMFLCGCSHPPKYNALTVACDAQGHPVFVTAR